MIGRTRSAWPAACAPGLALVLLLGACQKDTDPGPGGVTQGEARALDEAAEMLEQRPAPPLVDASAAADATAAAANAAGPAQ
jgi:hypothetical protein